MAYRAEIEIGVRGARELLELQKRLEGTSYKIQEINSKQATIFKGIAPSINNFTRQLQQAERALSAVAAGIPQETRAVKNYVDALENSNTARARQNQLIQEEITRRNGATAALEQYNAAAAAATQRGAATTMTGAYLRGQPRFGPQPAAGFDPAAGAARVRASVLAKEAIETGKLEKERFNLRTKYDQEIYQIMGKFQTKIDSKARTERLDAVLDEYKLREQKSTELFQGMLKDNEKLLRDFNKKLSARTTRSAEASRRRKQFREDLALGAGFPLLTGAGPGGVFGGVAGAVAGGGRGGFGLQILGSALGDLADRFVQTQSQLAASITETTDV
ncbi:MAG: hypothetical protein GY880_32935, partial [Planctomycetaceae bacterium]|nr:hypothetical protein [Planctomycetaceae bacterium]